MQAARSAVFSSKSYAARFPASESDLIFQFTKQHLRKKLSDGPHSTCEECPLLTYLPDLIQCPLRYPMQYMDQIYSGVEDPLLPQYLLIHLNPKEVRRDYQKTNGVLCWNPLLTSSTSCDLISGMKENTSIEIVKSTKMAKEEPQITIQVKKALNEVALNLVATVSSPLDESLGRGAETVGIKGRKPNTRLAMGIDREVCDQKFDNERAEDNIGDVAGDLASTPIASTKKQPTACSEASSIQDSSTHTISAGSGIEVVQPLEEVESSRKDETASKVLDGLKGESVLKGGQEGHESEKSQRETSKRVHSEEPPPERSTVWGGLKSLADGFINFWRKL
ncbi:uncharacterized protein LOC131236792 isoform X3 [Magnolia sinica]|uniref:uncharacterized protein LOC131236792 isoform X3 n=1 Tax=Magnolia sinica TaxID=86752 RepID=UPI00265B453D|nr:uncharacterized protein LOC131236792 isoform X3 [Magnolia sinica]